MMFMMQIVLLDAMPLSNTQPEQLPFTFMWPFQVI